MAIYKGTKYNLTSSQLTQISRLCVQEQGASGAAAEASQMANNYELNANKKKYPTLYDYVRNGGWYYRAAYYMDNGSASKATIAKVQDVLEGGNRVLPLYVDEHDCISDIAWIKNNGKEVSKTNKSNYIPNVTVIHNKMGSTYTFFCFPAPGCDPFGYTDNARAPHGGGGDEPEPEPPKQNYVTLSSIKLPVISEGNRGTAVAVWQAIIGVSADGIFGGDTDRRTKQWQKQFGLSADGIVGQKSWEKGFGNVDVE